MMHGLTNVKLKKEKEIWGSHSGVAKTVIFLGCSALSISK
jgi:hypothetical protein